MGWRCWQIVTEQEEKSSVEAFAFDWDLILTEMIVMFLMLLLSNFTFKFNDVLRKFLWAFEAEHNTLSSVLEIATSPITFSLFFFSNVLLFKENAVSSSFPTASASLYKMLTFLH